MLACLLSLATSGLLLAGGCRDTLDPFDRLHPGPGARLVVTDTLLADADTYIRQSTPNANWGTDTALQLGGGGKSRVLVRFDSTALRAVVGAGTLDSAWLEFTITAGPQGWGTNERTVDLHRLLRDWTELGATWNCAVDANTANSVPDCPTQGWDMTSNGNGTYAPSKTDRVKVSNGQSGVIRLGVTADVAAFLGGTQLHQGWVFRKTSESQGGEAIIFSRESGSQPRLVVRVTTSVVPPVPPDSLPAAVAASLFHTSNMLKSPNGKDWVPQNVLLVAFRPASTQAERQTAIDAISGTVVGGHRLDVGAYYIVQFPGTGTFTGLKNAIDILQTFPQVDHALIAGKSHPNYLRPVDGSGWSGWRLQADSADGPNWALEAIGAPFAWGCQVGSTRVTIGVVDEDFGHRADLDANVDPGSHVLWDINPLGQHGTEVASVIGAIGNNGAGMTGVAWATNLLLADVNYLLSAGLGSGGAANVGWVARSGARVVNLSRGINWDDLRGQGYRPSTPEDSAEVALQYLPLKRTLDSLDQESIRPILVISAGNDSVDAWWNGTSRVALDFPDRVLNVGGVRLDSTEGLALWGPSNYGVLVEIMAPAESVYTLDALTNPTPAPATGTSFSAPLVAGTAGLLFAFDPTLTAAEVKALLLAGAIRGGRTAGGIPILNAYESLKLAAERPGAPLCGNRVFVQGDSVFVQRGTSGPDEKIITMPGAGGDGWVLTYHGGRFLQALNPYQWTSTGWIPSDTIPQDFAQSLTGSALSRAWVPGNSPVSHDFDSTAFEVETSTSPRTFDLRLALLSDPSQSRLVTSFPGLWSNDAIAIPPVGPELVVGVLRDDGVYTNWDVYAVHQATGAQRFLFSRTGSVYLSPGFSEDGAELSLSRYQTDGQCVTEFLSPVTGAPLRSPVSYQAGGYPYCHGPAAWGASRRPVISTMRH